MSPEAQRIAIAEACGWKTEYIHGNGMDCDAYIDPRGLVQAQYPDYLNDLNAMHEAEKVLTEENSREFDEVLMDMCGTSGIHGAIHATATQRAEAFLRTLNLWKE